MHDKNAHFLGRGWGFPPSFDPDAGDVELVSQDDDIRQSLLILFTTIPGERVMRPRYGCDLHSQVFQRINTTTRTIIKGLISDAILYFEPRITLERIWFDDDADPREGILPIHIEYTIRKTNTRANMVYPFYFAEGTNVQPL